jgi:TolA-binding protein
MLLPGLKLLRLPLALFTLLVCLPANSYAQDFQQNRDQSYQYGLELYDQGLYEEAAFAFERFVRNSPQSPLHESALFYKVRSRAGSDSTHLANYYEEFIEQYPRSGKAGLLYIDVAGRLRRDGKADEAMDYYKQALETGISGEQSAEVMYCIAETAAEDQQTEEAIESYLEMADRYPESEWAPKALYARGRLYLTQSDYDASSEAFELLKSRYPNDPVTRRVGTALGESYYQKGEYEQAIEALKNAIPYLDDEQRSKAVILIAESHNYLNNFDRATTRYKEYINLNQGTDKVRNAYYGLGWLYHKQQIYHWAADAFEKASDGEDEMARKALYYKAVNEKLGNRYAQSFETFESFGDRFKSGLWVEEAYYEWAISAFEGGQYGDAIEILLELVRNGDELKSAGKVFTLLGEAYYANGEFTRAIQAFEEAEKSMNLDPAIKIQAQFQKAWVLFRNQAYEQAQPLFEQIYRDNRDSELGVEALFWSADSWYMQKQYGKAAEQFAVFVRNYPEHELIGAARYSLGWAYFIMGDFEKAAPPLEAFLENYNPPPIALFPYDTDTRLRIGDAYYALGDYSKSIQYYNQAIGAEPGGDYAMFQVGNSYYRANRTFEAVSTFRRLLRIYPFSRLREQAQYNIAYIYLNTSNYAQAITEFQTVIQKYPNTSWAARSQYNIGDAYYNAGEYEQAIAEYSKVLEQYPRSSYIIEAINGIQYAQLSAGEADSSSQILESFLDENPRSSTADQLRFRQAENIYQSGDYENAIRELRQYLRVTNSDRLAPNAYLYLAESYMQTGNIDQALQSYQAVVSQYPETDEAASALTSLGRIYYDLGNYGRSHDTFMKLLQEKQRYKLEAYIGMGNASLAQNDIDKAEVEFNEALSVNRGSSAARIGLAKVDIRKRNFAEAEEILESIAESNTTELGAEAQYNLGILRQEQGLYSDAIDEYAKVKVLYEAFSDWVAKSLFETARCHITLGNRGQALSALNSIVNDYPGTTTAVEAQQLINTLN